MKTKLHQIRSFIIHWLKASSGGHGVHSPFAFYLCEEVFYNSNRFYNFEKLEVLRKDLLQDSTQIPVLDLGAGSQKLSGSKRTIASIARHGISSAKQSELIFRLIQVLNLSTRIELGTSLGLNTLYMHTAFPKGSTYTVEGNPALSAFAKQMALSQQCFDITYIEGNFDKELPALLKRLKNFDLLYIDGNHQYEATLRYVKEALLHIHSYSVIILDDIYWSPAMTKAWNEIKTLPQVRLSLDLYHFGLLFFREEIKEKQHLSLYI